MKLIFIFALGLCIDIGTNTTHEDHEDPGSDNNFDSDKTNCMENGDNKSSKEQCPTAGPQSPHSHTKDQEPRENTRPESIPDVPTYLVRILVILLLCIILSTITIIICKYKGKRSATESQRDERPERGLPEEVQPQQKIITIYATANNPEVLGKQNSDHPYEEIPNAPPENIKRTVYVTLGPPPGDQQGPTGKAQQEDGTYSELAPAERESSI